MSTSRMLAATVALGLQVAGESAALGQRIDGRAPVQTLGPSGLGGLGAVTPLVVAGSPTGTPPDSPSNRVDPNTTSSPFAGVGSVFADFAPVDGNGNLGTGSLIHGLSPATAGRRDYYLTAAHVVDANQDGVADVSPANLLFVLNFGGNFTHVIPAAEIFVHPDYGDGNSNDDLALIRLATPAPAGVPVYNLLPAFSGFVEAINPVGYGLTGDPVSGYTPGSSGFTVKRSGLNQADVVGDDDEGGGAFEIFAADFDGPDGSTNVFDLGLPGFDPAIEGTYGNTLETTVGGGDSGGPSFLRDIDTKALVLGADGMPTLYGVNTFTVGSIANPAPRFGTFFGGMLVPAYAGWVESVMIPEPGALVLLAVGAAALLPTRRRSRR
jgi:hypothetical protein